MDPAAPDPSAPEALLGRFLALQQAGDWPGALPVIEVLAGLLPGNPRIQAYRAFTLERLGRDADALAAYDVAVGLDPGYVDALHNRACLLARRQDPRAEAAFAAVLARAPDHAAARQAQDQLRAQRLQPAFEAAHAKSAGGDRAGAVAAYRAILAELPDNVPVLHNLAGLLAERDPQEAATLWRRALALAPDDLEVAASLGQFLFSRGELEAALPHLEAVVARKPDHTAIAELVQAKSDRCDWDDLVRLTPRLAAAIRAGTPVIPLAAVRFFDEPELVTRAGRRFMQHVLDQAFPTGVTPRVHERPTAPSEKITIGYLSSDLRGHIIGLLLAAVLERHDRARFRIHAYSIGRRRDATTERIRAAVDRFDDVAVLSPAEIAARIAADGVDVLVEMNGWTRDGRSEALAPRPAPVQMQWLGYPGTSGGNFVDYVIADDFSIPAGTPGFDERILRLPRTHQPFDPRMAVTPTPAREALGLPRDGLVLASLVPHWKLAPAVFTVWLRALARWPDAVLWLVDGPTAARQRLVDAAASHGVAPERLVFARRVPMAAFLGQLGAADLFLDTYPYGGHSTTSAALYAGLPIVALVGKSFASRVAGSVLHAAGQGDLVADTLADYERLIHTLGDDRAALAARRASLVPRTAPLFDLARFTRALERGYEIAWQRWIAGAAPQDITVDPA